VREDSFAQPGERAGAVAFEAQEVFAGPEDRLDALTDRREMRAPARSSQRRGRTIVAPRALAAAANARPT
jgi:hypothetical protein